MVGLVHLVLLEDKEQLVSQELLVLKVQPEHEET